MRARTATHRFAVPLLFGALLSACDAVNEPSAPASRPAASSFKAIAPSGGAEAVARPYGAKLVWSTFAFVAAAQSGDPLFGGRCSVPSWYVEYGHVSGEIMHAGLSQGTGSHCVQVTPPTTITFTDGILSFETASRDSLAIRYGGGTVSLANGLFVLDSYFNIAGGTGRFRLATGAGTQHGQATATPQEVLAGAPIQLEQSGVITYAPGHARP